MFMKSLTGICRKNQNFNYFVFIFYKRIYFNKKFVNYFQQKTAEENFEQRETERDLHIFIESTGIPN